MIELYHFGFSTCSQKVRLVLAEKGLEFVSHEVDLLGGAQHDPEYVKLNPNHVVPTLVHDGTTLIESTLINEYLDEAFPDDADAAIRSARPPRCSPVDKVARRADSRGNGESSRLRSVRATCSCSNPPRSATPTSMRSPTRRNERRGEA